MISFNKPPKTGNEAKYLAEAIEVNKLSGDGRFTKKCSQWMEERFGAHKVLLTTSATHALEMAADLCALSPGDEVILPSYTFSSTANAFIKSGARLVFVDTRPDTMNIDETLIEAAITDKTRAICVMHYAGVSCDMDRIMAIAQAHGLKVVEDAAQGVMSTYKGRALGTIGDFGCYSFHETKNYTMGEGGALVISAEENIDQAEILREKGTDRSRFFRGQVDKYRWVDYGSSYLPSELNAAYLWAQLEQADAINEARLAVWRQYREGLAGLVRSGAIEVQHIPEDCVHNAHMFYIKAKDLAERTRIIAYLRENGVNSVFHYVPLHSAPAGLKFGRFSGQDRYTTKESERLLRLPLYYPMDPADTQHVIEAVERFYRGNA